MPSIPQGYVWSRDIDPNATFNAQSGQLKVGDRVYNQGSYFLQNGRAYINPNAHNQATQRNDQVGVRQLFGGRDDSVTWNGKNGVIGTPSGQLNRGDYTLNQNGRATIGYDQAAALMLNKPTRELNQENFQNTINMFKGAYDGLFSQTAGKESAFADYASKQKAANEAAVNAAYQQAQSNLQRQETSSWNRMMESARARGIEDSGLMNYEQAKVANSYAPEYQQMESNRAAGLAQAAAQAAQIEAQAKAAGDAQRAQMASQIFSSSINQLNRMQDIDLRKNEQLYGHYMGMYDRSREDQRWGKEFDSKQTQQTFDNNFRTGQQKADNTFRDKQLNESVRQYDTNRQDKRYEYDTSRQDRQYEYDTTRQDRLNQQGFENRLEWRKYSDAKNGTTPGKPKGKDATKAEALQAFSDMKKSGPIAVPEMLAQIDAKAQEYVSQGYDLQTVRDTAVYVATNGRYKNESEWDKVGSTASKKMNEQPVISDPAMSYQERILALNKAVKGIQ